MNTRLPRWKQIGTRRQQLPELDESGTQVFEIAGETIASARSFFAGASDEVTVESVTASWSGRCLRSSVATAA